MTNNNTKKVLVTGITGFIGLHVAVQLLNNGYAVRGSMRNLVRKDSILEILKSNCPGLNRDNIDIARRTIAKYREMLNILPSNQRKNHYS